MTRLRARCQYIYPEQALLLCLGPALTPARPSAALARSKGVPVVVLATPSPLLLELERQTYIGKPGHLGSMI